MIHELKCHPAPFSALLSGSKTHEIRKDDRGFSVNDVLVLREWDPELVEHGGSETEHGLHLPRGYTGRDAAVVVTYISRGPDWGLARGDGRHVDQERRIVNHVTVPHDSLPTRLPRKPVSHSAGWKWTHQDQAVVNKVRDHLRAQQRWRRECARVVVEMGARR